MLEGNVRRRVTFKIKTSIDGEKHGGSCQREKVREKVRET